MGGEREVREKREVWEVRERGEGGEVTPWTLCRTGMRVSQIFHTCAVPGEV